MATPPSAPAFAQLLRDEGVTVVEVGDWEDHNRNHMGPWGPVHGVMIHHTVTSGSARTVEICRDGYAELPGPLCHGVIAKNGTVHLVGYGRANHAGSGDSSVLTAVLTEEQRLPAATKQDTDGNARFYGFECENRGDGEDPWPAAQLDAIERVSAAICRAHGWTERSVIGHLEWQPGKIDPKGFTMTAMRSRITARLDNNQQEEEKEEDDMQLSDQVTLGDWVAKRWPDDKGLQDGRISVNTALGSGYAHARTAATLARVAADNSTHILAQLGAQQATIEKLVEALGTDGGLTAEEIKAAAAAGAQAALDRLAAALKED
jgi:hypothetical protein